MMCVLVGAAPADFAYRALQAGRGEGGSMLAPPFPQVLSGWWVPKDIKNILGDVK